METNVKHRNLFIVIIYKSKLYGAEEGIVDI